MLWQMIEMIETPKHDLTLPKKNWAKYIFCTVKSTLFIYVINVATGTEDNHLSLFLIEV